MDLLAHPMKTTSPAFRGTGSLRHIAATAVCVLLAVALLACGDSATDERVLELEAEARTLEASLEALADENADLKGQIAVLRGRVNDQEAILQEISKAAAKIEADLYRKKEWSESEEQPEGTVVERTAALAEDAGGEVHYLDHPARGDRTILVMPLDFVDGETPLIVSLHGYGGNSADHSVYFPLHERVNSEGFALMLPTGSPDGQGNPFWNPTDNCCEGGKSGEDDVAYLTELVAAARKVMDFGPVYFFGYSNGGFMSHHMACKGLPDLRAVASLAGTSYVEDSSCEGAPPVSVLHVHGTEDEVILFEGDETDPEPKSGERAFYAGARDMVTRWSDIAGCDWPEDPQPYATLDLDRYVAGPETQAFRLGAGCAEGISIELWVGEGSSHAPGYGEAFMDALLGWLLSQE